MPARTTTALALTFLTAAADAAPPPQPEGRILVRLHPHTTPDQCDALLDAIGATIEHEYTLVPGLIALRTREPANAALDACADFDHLLRYAEPDHHLSAQAVPTDPLYAPNQYNLNNTGQMFIANRLPIPGQDVRAQPAWDVTTGDPDFVVAVVDGAINHEHPDLVANRWTNPGESGPDALGGDKATNGIDDDANGYVDDVHGWDFAGDDNDTTNPADNPFHGTATSSVIGARPNNLQGIAGVCWNVSIMPLQIFDASGALLSDAIEALEYAVDMGVKVSNHSYGGPISSQAQSDAILAAADAGHIFASGAGNNAMPQTDYPTLYPHPNILSVPATDERGWLAPFTNYNQVSVDIGAPGTHITVAGTDTAGNDLYAIANGSSFAGPHVAAACALLWSHQPALSMQEVIDRVLCSARPHPDLDGQVLTGGALDLERLLSGNPMPPQLDVLRPLPEYVEPGTPVTLTFRIASCDTILDLATARLHYAVDDDPFQSTTLNDLGDDYHDAAFTVTTCGDTLAYYLSVEDDTGALHTLPENAPADTFTAELGTLSDIWTDDFETDKGWTVGGPLDTATTGIWERADPEKVNDGWNFPLQPDDAYQGATCYVTGASMGASWFSNDVDNGRTTLTSPTIDASAATTLRISYARWYVNDAGPNPHVKPFIVQISDDNGLSWVTADIPDPAGYRSSGRWWTHTIRADQLITPTSTLRLRFIADDPNPGSVVDALVDDVRVAQLICTAPPPPCPGDLNDDGLVNVFDFSLFAPAFGATPADPSWNPDADLDNNDQIDVFDFAIFATAFAQPCP